VQIHTIQLPRQWFICLNPYSGHAVKKYVKEDIS